MRPRPRPRPITGRPRPKKWSRDHAGIVTLTSLSVMGSSIGEPTKHEQLVHLLFIVFVLLLQLQVWRRFPLFIVVFVVAG